MLPRVVRRMPEEENKEEKLEFTAESEAFGYISLDQARVRAIEHARDNRDFYGPTYARGELVWEVVRQEESEGYYGIRLSYRPALRFNGKPGIEQFSIDKTGPIALRQISMGGRDFQSGSSFRFRTTPFRSGPRNWGQR